MTKLLGQLWGAVKAFVTSPATAGFLFCVALVVVGIVGGFFLDKDASTPELPEDTPPPEYLYLDNDRVLAYLGQLSGGLSNIERRRLSQADDLSAGGAAGGAEVSRTRRLESSVERDVTPTATDRFYRLLAQLEEERGKRGKPYLTTHPADAGLLGIQEGDFIRIKDARLDLPRFAAVYPRAAFVERGDETLRPLYAPQGPRDRAILRRYRSQVGKNPRLPLVTELKLEGNRLMRVIVPVRYRALGSEPALLSGRVTIVGKVVVNDPRDPVVNDPSDPKGPEDYYLDRQTLRTFGGPLQEADRPLLDLLGYGSSRMSLGSRRGAAFKDVRSSSELEPPVLVVLPVAIYQ